MRPSTFVCALAVLLCAALLPLASAAPPEQARDKGPTDAEIIIALEDNLLFDWPVIANDIDIQSIDGIVTLSGWAPNLISKERAVRIAEAVKGVRGIVDRIEVRAVARADEEIRKDVETALHADPATDSYEITTEVAGGTVTLKGTVQSNQEKGLAASVAKGVKGVKAVSNVVRIDYGEKRSDADILEDIRAVLERDVWLGPSNINVVVNDGHVILTGTVGSLAGRNRARNNAYVRGVISVNEGGLVIAPHIADEMRRAAKNTVRTDLQIKEAVEDAFLVDPRVAPSKPEVSVRKGVVALSGSVGDLRAKVAAEQDAMNTIGVWRVKNHLKVRSPQSITDAALADHVSDALNRDPWLDRHDIGLSALNGRVRIMGTVDSQYEKSRAENILYRVKGVTSVSNDLDVRHPASTYRRWGYSQLDDVSTLPYYDRPSFYLPFRDRAWLSAPDAEIKEEIEYYMAWSPFVDTERVNVIVRDGVATLTGTVGSSAAVQSAIDDAYKGGALSVLNKLTIK